MYVRYVLRSLGLLFFAGLLLRNFVLTSYVMSGHSMSPLIESGDFILGAKWGLSDVARGEVLVLRCPQAIDHICLKRVVGLPGDRVEIRDNQFILNDQKKFAFKGHVDPLVLPPRYIFVLNEQADDELDSREWGAVSLDLAEARAIGIWLSLDWYEPDLAVRAWPHVRWDRLTLLKAAL